MKGLSNNFEFFILEGYPHPSLQNPAASHPISDQSVTGERAVNRYIVLYLVLIKTFHTRVTENLYYIV